MIRSPRVILLSLVCALVLVSESPASTLTNRFDYAPAPPDNPLKGFVTYPRPSSDFPHSLVWNYIPLRALMTGLSNFNWQAFEAELDDAASQGRQFIPRFYLDFPGRPSGIPQFLLDAGLQIYTWTNYQNDPFPPAVCFTPDYNSPVLRSALTNFISALGARYDRDPRLAFVPLGILGLWGEWHNHPRTELFASKTVQAEVLDAYAAAFKTTRLLARYPAGSSDATYAANNLRPLGYHDDSFAWATIPTGRPEDSWFFVSRLNAAGTATRWRGYPIGGEVRPEVWNCLWKDPSCAPAGQEFVRCATNTHATWLANHGVFANALQGPELQRALAGARLLGYEFHITQATIIDAYSTAPLRVSVSVTNSGIAPFYYDWPLEFGVLSTNGVLAASWVTSLKLTAIQPAAGERYLDHLIPNLDVPPGDYVLGVRVVHPLANAKPLRFANTTQDQHRPGWLSLGLITVLPRARLNPEQTLDGRVRISLVDAPVELWRVETSSDLSNWEPVTSNTSILLIVPASERARFFRLVHRP